MSKVQRPITNRPDPEGTPTNLPHVACGCVFTTQWIRKMPRSLRAIFRRVSNIVVAASGYARARKHAMIPKISVAAAALLLSVTFLMGQAPVGLAPFSTFLKANSSVLQVKTDAAGFIYVYGVTAPSGSDPEDAGYNQEVFVLRLNPSATAVTYTVYLGGSSPTYGGAMTVDPAGNAYVTGYTDAPDFPTVPYAPGPTTVNAQFPFVAKIASSGTIVYSTFFSNGAGAKPQSIAVDGSGDVIVSGSGSGTGFPTTAGAYVNQWNSYPPFITKLDPNGTKLLFSSVGVGGSSLAFDGSGNILVAGTSYPASPNPAP